MPDQTALWDIPYSLGSDSADTIDDTMQDLAERLDIMMGETGVKTMTPSAADTNTASVVMLSRTYPTNVAVMLQINSGFGVTTVVDVYPSNELTDRFTLNIRSTSTVARDIRWWARPRPA